MFLSSEQSIKKLVASAVLSYVCRTEIANGPVVSSFSTDFVNLKTVCILLLRISLFYSFDCTGGMFSNFTKAIISEEY
jgi:hypothetical protein